jgi:hypothetical protein
MANGKRFKAYEIVNRLKEGTPLKTENAGAARYKCGSLTTVFIRKWCLKRLKRAD